MENIRFMIVLDRELSTPSQYADIDGSLRATRDAEILDRVVALENGFRITPESFQRGLYPHWGILRRDGARECFLLTEREFQVGTQNIDSFFHGLPSQLIEHFLDQQTGNKINILDVGGGRDGRTARGISIKYPTTQVTNVDMVAINENEGNYTAIHGDITNLNLPNASIDFAYSHQVLPYMSREASLARHIRVIEEVKRVLRPGGVATIDFSNSAQQESFGALNLDGILTPTDQSLGYRTLPKTKSYGGVFLFIVRDPISTAVLDIGSRAPTVGYRYN